MKVALFVEGSHAPPPPRQKEALARIWGEHLVELAGRGGFSHIFPISKLHIEQLDPKCPRASGNAEALDQLIARHLRHPGGFDAAVVAWDVLPPLRPEPPLEPGGCRWLETRWIMRRLAESVELPAAWTRVAAERAVDYEGRTNPADRAAPRPLLWNEVRLLCMEPEFEGLLLMKKELRTVLGATGKSVKGWPTNWTPTAQRRGKAILHEAIEAARKVHGGKAWPVRGTIAVNAPNEWAEWLLRNLMAMPAGRERLASDPIVFRLADLL